MNHRWVVILAVAFLPRSALASDPTLDLNGLAQQVARLRGEIEVMDARLDEQRESRRTELRGLAVQKSTLEAELQREQVRAKQLADRMARGKERTRAAEERQRHLAGAVRTVVETLKRTVARGIPLSIAERTFELDEIAREVEAGTLPPTAAIDRLWAWVDGELELTRENGIHQQSLALEGEEVLADVAHLGMVALYFRAPGNRFGTARKQGDVWAWELTPAKEDRERIQALFSALEKDVTNGFFVLPGALQAAAEGEIR